MTTRHQSFGYALALATLCSAAACDNTTTGNDDESDLTEIQPRISSRWVGHEVGASPGRWYSRGPLQLGDVANQVVNVRVDPSIAGAPRLHDERVTRLDFRRGEQLEIRMDPADLRKVAERLEQRGYARGTQDASATPETALQTVSKLVIGTDSRIPKGIHEHGFTLANFNRIGSFGGCTAAFVGTPEDDGFFVLTAAHCLYDSSGNEISPSFVPRRDGCSRPDGTTISGCDPSPYGTWPSVDAFVPAYFANNCAGVSPTSEDCLAEDIAIVEVTRPSSVTYPGAFAFDAWRRATVDTFYRFNRGYPSCDSVKNPVAPPNCRANTLFGDSNSCPLGTMSHPNPSTGWHMLIRHTCDTNGGHSGSPMYIEPTGVQGVSSIFGVHNGGVSSVSGVPVTNYLRRITPTFRDQMLNFMGID
jgi:hypothetical protein